MELYETTEKNDWRKPYGIVAEIVNDGKSVCPWISRHTINFAYGKLIATKEKTFEEESPDVIGTPNLGGQPIGSTKEAKAELKSRLRDYLNACALEFHEEKNIAKRDGKYLKKGCLTEIMKEQKKIFKL